MGFNSGFKGLKKGQERDLEHEDIQTASKIFYELFHRNGKVRVCVYNETAACVSSDNAVSQV